MRSTCRLHDPIATRVEAAAGGHIERIRVGDAEMGIGYPEARFGGQHRGQERLRVGMPGRPEELIGLGLFYNAPQIHDRDPGGHVFDHGEIVTNQQIREAEIPPQILQQVEKVCDCTETSSAEVGSSQMTMRGSLMSARAMATRWRWPPESWLG